MSFTLSFKLPPLAALDGGEFGYTPQGLTNGPTHVVPGLGAFHLTFHIGTAGLPSSIAAAANHRRKWRAEVNCARFLNGDLDRAKIVMALVVKDSEGKTISAVSPCARWFQGKEGQGAQRTLPASASTGGRPLTVKAAWGSDGNLRSDPMAGRAYTLLCRLAPLEGVGKDGSIELFEDEEEIVEAFAAWINGAGASAAAAASPAASATTAARAATRSSARLHNSPADTTTTGGGVNSEGGNKNDESFVVRIPCSTSTTHRSAAATVASAAPHHPPLPGVPGGGKMPAPSPSGKRGGAGASPAAGGKRRRGRSVLPSPPSSSSDTDASLCSSCGGAGVGVKPWQGVGGGCGGGGQLVVPTVDQLMRFGYGELRELQVVVGQAMDRLREDETLCPVCLAKEKVFACIPCGHRFCEDDIAKLIDGKCHVCSHKVTQKLRLYN